MSAVTPFVPVVVCGRAFSNSEIDSISSLISFEPSLCRRQIALRTCELLGWKGPDGRLKEMSCRVALLRLQALGRIQLPPPLKRSGNRKPYIPSSTIIEREGSLTCQVGEVGGLEIRTVAGRRDSELWNEAVSRFHYLGYKRLPGAQMRYLVESQEGLLAVLGFGASAWKVAPRDRWIGWSELQRKARLHLVVNNARFLILPWVRSRNLASWILSRCAQRLPSDFKARYGYSPVLLETFVERERFRGTCYKASNWTHVGDTQGRGKLDSRREARLPVKQVYVYPLERRFREVLCG